MLCVLLIQHGKLCFGLYQACLLSRYMSLLSDLTYSAMSDLLVTHLKYPRASTDVKAVYLDRNDTVRRWITLRSELTALPTMPEPPCKPFCVHHFFISFPMRAYLLIWREVAWRGLYKPKVTLPVCAEFNDTSFPAGDESGSGVCQEKAWRGHCPGQCHQSCGSKDCRSTESYGSYPRPAIRYGFCKEALWTWHPLCPNADKCVLEVWIFDILSKGQDSIKQRKQG